MVWQIDFKGETIVVTGGNRGIGLSVSQQCAEAGANIAIIYRSSTDAVDIARSIGSRYGVKCKAYQCDVEDESRTPEVVQLIWDELGPIAGAVCNAGVHFSKPALSTTRKDYDTQMGPNVWGVFNTAKAVVSVWRKHDYKKGRIVFLGSVTGTIAPKSAIQVFYNTSKAALRMMAKSLAAEWADNGVLVNVVSPGLVSTEMMRRFYEQMPGSQETLEKGVVLSRTSEPVESADMVVYYLSDKASYMTGSEAIIDGGMTIW